MYLIRLAQSHVHTFPSPRWWSRCETCGIPRVVSHL